MIIYNSAFCAIYLSFTLIHLFWMFFIHSFSLLCVMGLRLLFILFLSRFVHLLRIRCLWNDVFVQQTCMYAFDTRFSFRFSWEQINDDIFLFMYKSLEWNQATPTENTVEVSDNKKFQSYTYAKFFSQRLTSFSFLFICVASCILFHPLKATDQTSHRDCFLIWIEYEIRVSIDEKRLNDSKKQKWRRKRKSKKRKKNIFFFHFTPHNEIFVDRTMNGQIVHTTCTQLNTNARMVLLKEKSQRKIFFSTSVLKRWTDFTSNGLFQINILLKGSIEIEILCFVAKTENFPISNTLNMYHIN